MPEKRKTRLRKKSLRRLLIIIIAGIIFSILSVLLSQFLEKRGVGTYYPHDDARARRTVVREEAL